MFHLTRLLCFTLCLVACRGIATAETVIPIAGVRIDHSATFKGGSYHLADPGAGTVQVSGHDFTLDCRAVKLRGPGAGKGVGIRIVNARNVTLRGADLSGWQWGIVIEHSSGVTLLDCTASRNADLPPGTVIDESGTGSEDDHGGGIVLRDCRDCRVRHCAAQRQWDGIDVIRSTGVVIEDGDYSYNGNWGVHFWNASDNTFRHNRAVWCTTGAGMLYQALTGWQTYDAQAVGIDHNSCENLIESNDLRFGGDGIFIRANEGPITPGTVVPPRNGSHRNILRNNDCSFSPNNAIEVDLVDDTIIEGNNCSYSHYGMWLGYSRQCVVRNNLCIGDTAHAVEIENGQDDRFENNVFGYDDERRAADPNSALIFLRWNGRDKTPSGPYTLRHNLFLNGVPVRLISTELTFEANQILNARWAPERSVVADEASRVTQRGSVAIGLGTPPTLHLPGTARPGSVVTLTGRALRAADTLPIVRIEGIPAQVIKATAERISFLLPADMWDRPAQTTATVSVFNGQAMAKGAIRLIWPDSVTRIEGITPNPARVTDTVTISGRNLSGRVLFNGKEATVLERSPTGGRLTVKLPDGIISASGYNLRIEQGEGEKALATWPITFRVEVPREQQPHLLSARFSPTRLNVGELLTVTFTVRNNLPTPVALMTQPAPPFIYDEGETWNDRGLTETPHTLHLRVTSDHPGNHESGSWPWLFGFSKARLMPGETVTLTGSIRTETPGEHEFRVGLVESGFRFIDDNAFRTKIVVMPK